MNRRSFLVRTSRIALALPFALGAVAACGSDDGGDDAPDAAQGGDCSGGTNIAIGSNHSHAMSVSDADVTAGAEKEYNLQGGSAHPHTVTLTAADFTKLQGGTTVMKTSSNDSGHTHSITVSCS